MSHKTAYESQSARDAQRLNYGDNRYWQYLDDKAKEYSLYYEKQGDMIKAKEMLTRSLDAALVGNEGN
jgi:hypothetical protein